MTIAANTANSRSLNTAARARTRSVTSSNTLSEHNRGGTDLWARGIAALVVGVAAVITLNGSRSMSGGMRMPGGWDMSMMWMPMPGQSVAGSTGIFLLMWLAMMIAMMLPSSWPMLELYRKVAVSSRQKYPAAATAVGGVG